nr:MAG TPA: hypothetical protein [Caudoviricetes sp.]
MSIGSCFCVLQTILRVQASPPGLQVLWLTKGTAGPRPRKMSE